MHIPLIPASRQANFGRLIILRWIFLVLATLGMWIAWQGFDLPMPVAPLSASLVVLACANALFSWQMQRGLASGDAIDVAMQLLIDITALSAMLFFTGGANNPLVSLFLLIIIVAAVLLPRGLVWLVSLAAVASYSLLTYFYLPLPGPPGDPMFTLRLHLFGMWATFVVSAILIAGLVSRMAVELRSRDRELSRSRETQLRDERLIALGTLAAAAAHELGTPLGTLRVLIDELKHDYQDDDLLAADLQLAAEQVAVCRRALERMRESAGMADSQHGQSPQPLAVLFARMMEHWSALKPAALVQYSTDLEAAPAGHFDPTFAPALLSLLNNAVEASPEPVEVQAVWAAGWLEITIANRGPNLSSEQLAALGEPMLSSKPDGMGLGVFLANATLERLGGAVSLVNRQGGGVLAIVRMPWPIVRESV